uniref:Uncharacterized protein n=1 Tax=Capra hircus TaxID=9925 RepID=A0A452F856_CAPHI
MAASRASQRAVEGLLKNKSSTTSSLAASAEQPGDKRSQKWDGMNIQATSSSTRSLGTPSHSMVGDEEDPLSDSETAEALTPETAAAESSEPKYQVHEPESSGDEDTDLSPVEGGKK